MNQTTSITWKTWRRSRALGSAYLNLGGTILPSVRLRGTPMKVGVRKRTPIRGVVFESTHNYNGTVGLGSVLKEQLFVPIIVE